MFSMFFYISMDLCALISLARLRLIRRRRSRVGHIIGLIGLNGEDRHIRFPKTRTKLLARLVYQFYHFGRPILQFFRQVCSFLKCQQKLCETVNSYPIYIPYHLSKCYNLMFHLLKILHVNKEVPPI